MTRVFTVRARETLEEEERAVGWRKGWWQRELCGRRRGRFALIQGQACHVSHDTWLPACLVNLQDLALLCGIFSFSSWLKHFPLFEASASVTRPYNQTKVFYHRDGQRAWACSVMKEFPVSHMLAIWLLEVCICEGDQYEIILRHVFKSCWWLCLIKSQIESPTSLVIIPSLISSNSHQRQHPVNQYSKCNSEIPPVNVELQRSLGLEGKCLWESKGSPVENINW